MAGLHGPKMAESPLGPCEPTTVLVTRIHVNFIYNVLNQRLIVGSVLARKSKLYEPSCDGDPWNWSLNLALWVLSISDRDLNL
ncbi:hypothetical protein CRG98_008454 [Punica granatum]|uniref:Uncharacterized protein n=1 Tax=Punica granatum TaxID=22663 RepID=A0A2I0KTH4_PUNGR|nr:hypothetical protein CRG98_008454 [Punica granatum]